MSTRTLSVRFCRTLDGALHRGRGHIPQTRIHTRLKAASTSISVTTEAQEDVACELLCPICLKTEFRVDQSVQPPSLSCDRCCRSFDATSTFVDLTLSSGAADTAYTLSRAAGTATFQNPLVGFVYERGWRQSFRTAGFPGPDREFEMAMEFLQPVTGDAVMDLSCGSGLFTRRFLSSGAFSSVVAVDYSVAMLTQTKQFIDRMDSEPKASLQLVRADVSRLPFPTGSFNAIFSGAALHCWPNPSMAFAEISRLLSPGGVFVFSTFTRLPKAVDDFLEQSGLQAVRSLIPGRRPSSLINYWDEQSLKDLSKLAGLEDYQSIRNRQFIMVSVRKPKSDHY